MEKPKYYGKQTYKGKYPYRKKGKNQGKTQYKEDDNWYYKH